MGGLWISLVPEHSSTELRPEFATGPDSSRSTISEEETEVFSPCAFWEPVDDE